jgi:hypothetical protein
VFVFPNLFKKLKAPSDENIREVNLKIKKRFIRGLRKRRLVEDFEEEKDKRSFMLGRYMIFLGKNFQEKEVLP